MKQSHTNFLDCCAKHATENACKETLVRQHWLHEFICPKYGLKRVNSEAVRSMTQRLSPDAVIRTNAFTSMATLGQTHRHHSKNTPAHKMNDWLPLVNVVISNFKQFIGGTFHGVSPK